MWPFDWWRRFWRRIESLGDSRVSIDLEELKELAEKKPTKKYINLLVLDLSKAELDELVLRSSSPLPHLELISGTRMPTFASVVNRLKIMANLYPMIYHQPKEGKVELTIHGRDAVLHLRFDDTAPDRSVHLRLEWLDDPPPPGSLA